MSFLLPPHQIVSQTDPETTQKIQRIIDGLVGGRVINNVELSGNVLTVASSVHLRDHLTTHANIKTVLLKDVTTSLGPHLPAVLLNLLHGLDSSRNAIETISLAGNALGTHTEIVDFALDRFPQLRELNLFDTGLCGTESTDEEGVQTLSFAQVLGKVRTNPLLLEKLHVGSTRLGEYSDGLGAALEMCPNLRHLEANDCALWAAGVNEIFGTWTGKKIEYLGLRDINFCAFNEGEKGEDEEDEESEEEQERIYDELAQTKFISFLGIANNLTTLNFSEAGTSTSFLNSIFDAFPTESQIRVLLLHGCKGDISTLNKCLESLEKLKRLDTVGLVGFEIEEGWGVMMQRICKVLHDRRYGEKTMLDTVQGGLVLDGVDDADGDSGFDMPFRKLDLEFEDEGLDIASGMELSFMRPAPNPAYIPPNVAAITHQHPIDGQFYTLANIHTSAILNESTILLNGVSKASLRRFSYLAGGTGMRMVRMAIASSGDGLYEGRIRDVLEGVYANKYNWARIAAGSMVDNYIVGTSVLKSKDGKKMEGLSVNMLATHFENTLYGISESLTLANRTSEIEDVAKGLFNPLVFPEAQKALTFYNPTSKAFDHVGYKQVAVSPATFKADRKRRAEQEAGQEGAAGNGKGNFKKSKVQVEKDIANGAGESGGDFVYEGDGEADMDLDDDI